MDRTLSGATIPSQSGPGSNGNEGVLCIPQSSSITETSVFYTPSRLGKALNKLQGLICRKINQCMLYIIFLLTSCIEPFAEL